jgi:hypothetical protein
LSVSALRPACALLTIAMRQILPDAPKSRLAMQFAALSDEN